MRGTLTLGIGGLGVIGSAVAEAVNAGMHGIELAAVAARDLDKAAARLAGIRPPPALVSLGELAGLADVVLESAGAAAYDEIAEPAVEAGRIFVTLSSGALLERPGLIARAQWTGARIIVPSGGILALDGLKAAAESGIDAVELVTRKPPASLAGAPYLVERDVDVSALSEASRVFAGNAREAAQAFPANANVAASVSLAGIGPERTRVEIWADPAIARNTQLLRVRSKSAEFTVELASHPMPGNPRTGSLTVDSAIATLRALRASLTVGL